MNNNYKKYLKYKSKYNQYKNSDKEMKSRSEFLEQLKKTMTLEKLQSILFNEKKLINNYDPLITNNFETLWKKYINLAYPNNEVTEIIKSKGNLLKKNIIKKIQDTNFDGGAKMPTGELFFKDKNSGVPISNIGKTNWYYMDMTIMNNIQVFQKLAKLALELDVKNLVIIEPRRLELERECWRFLELLDESRPKKEYIFFTDSIIEDIDAGNLTCYTNFYGFMRNNFNKSTCIHCLAGCGRTGAFVLFYILYLKSIGQGKPLNLDVPLDADDPLDSARWSPNKSLSHETLTKYLDGYGCHEDLIEELLDTGTRQLTRRNKILDCNLLIRRLNLIYLSAALLEKCTEVRLYILSNDEILNDDLKNNDLIEIIYEETGNFSFKCNELEWTELTDQEMLKYFFLSDIE
jgi:hypothetical protein